MSEPFKDSEWNPRYLCYATASGFNERPVECMDADLELWRGGKMVPFILWMNERWMQFEELVIAARNMRPLPSYERGLFRYHYRREFDRWLQGGIRL